MQVLWDQDHASTANGKPYNPGEDLRYYSRGLFNHPVITRLDGVRGKASHAYNSLHFKSPLLSPPESSSEGVWILTYDGLLGKF